MKKILTCVLFISLAVALSLTAFSLGQTAQAEEVTPATYFIETEEEFLAFHKKMIVGSCGNDTYILTSDIYLDRLYAEGKKLGTPTSTATPDDSTFNSLSFKGTFDGRGHAIVGLREPLAYLVDTVGSIKNLQIIGVSNAKYAVAYWNKGTIDGVEVVGETSYAGMTYRNDGSILRSLAVVNGSNIIGDGIVLSYDGIGSIGSGEDESLGYGKSGENEYFEGTDIGFFNDGEYNSYAELNYSILTDGVKSSVDSINLFNTPLLNVPEDFDFADYIDENYSAEFFNTNGLTYSFDKTREYFSPIYTPSATQPSGEGTKVNPYLISTPDELAWLGELSEGEYALLTKNINLDEYEFENHDYLIGAFSGNFDGGGKSITMGATKGSDSLQARLFGTIMATAKITDLNLVGSLAMENRGEIYGVSARNSDEFIKYNAGGYVMRTDVVGETFIKENLNEGIVVYSRFAGERFLGSTSDDSIVVDCFYDANTASDNGIAFTALTANIETSMVLFGSFVEADMACVDASGRDDIFAGDWSFGQEAENVYEPYGWGYVRGIEDVDVPMLIFPADRIAYKNVVKIDNKSGEEKYAKNNGYVSCYLQTLPAGTETGSYTPFGDGTNPNLFVGANGNIYELLQGESGGNTVTNVNKIITNDLSSATKNYLATKELKWEVKAIEEDEYTPFTGSHFDTTAYPSSVFHLKWNDDVVYLEAYLTISTIDVQLQYVYISKGITINNFTHTLDLVNYYNGRLADLGYTFNDVYLRLLDKDGNYLSLINGFVPVSEEYFDGSEYTIEITTPCTADYTASVQRHTISLLKGEMDYGDIAVLSKIGGTVGSPAVTFQEEGITFEDDNFYFDGYDFASVTFLEVISRSDAISGSVIVGVDGVRDVGLYTLDLNVSQKYFVDKTISISFRVKRKLIEVYATIDGQEEVTLNYYDAIDESRITYHLADGTPITTLVGAGYHTNYWPGQPITTGGEFYTLFFELIGDTTLNPNYDILKAPRSVKIYVNPVKVTLDDGAFSDLEVTFDEAEHTLILDESKIQKNTLESGKLEYSLEYSYDGNVANEPFKFLNSGVYQMGIKVVPLSTNYLPSDEVSATLTILKKRVAISAGDSYVNYGEDASYNAVITALDGVELASGYDAYIVEDTHYSLTSAYDKGGTKAGSTLPITLNLLSYETIGEDKVIGNFIVLPSAENGTLTVGKKTYALDMVTEYEYTGSGVKLDFNGEEITFSEGYPKYKYQTGGVAYDFVGVPSEACDSTFIYIVQLKVDESDEYYGTMDRTKYPMADSNGIIAKTFTIYKKTIPVSNLYVFDGGEKVALSDNMSLIYDGEDVVIDIDRTEFVGGGNVTFRFRYRTFTSDEYVESSAPIKLKDAVKIRDISLTIDGGSNYYTWTSAQTITSFEIAPRLLKLQPLTALSYKGYDYTLSFLTNRINALGYVSGYEPIGDEEVKLKVSILGGATAIALPGTYTLLVSSQNPNYTLGEDYRTGQTINTSHTTIDLSNVDFGEFEYGVLNASAPYVEKEMEFMLDNNETLTQTIKFMIDFNSGIQISSLAPGSYNVTRAESKSAIINGELTDLISFGVLNGQGKIKINPVEIAFDYLNMLEDGVGIKPSYVYGDEALKSLPATVVRNMTWAVSTGTTFYTETPKITVIPNETPLHAGEYTFSAKAGYQTKDDSGELVDCFKIKSDLTTYKVVVEKRKVSYEVLPVSIFIGDALPTFSVRFPISGASPLPTDTLGYEFTVDGFDVNNAQVGEYAVIVKAKLNVGGYYFEDYELIKINENAKELTVSYHEFDSGLSATGVDAVYSATEILPVVLGLPDGATVTYSERPINAGEYEVIVTVSKQNYLDKEFVCVVNIAKATPTIVLNGGMSFAYDVRHVLSASDVNGYAHLNGTTVEGTFYFNKTSGIGEEETLRYGEYTYSVGFTPASSNFNAVEDVDYVMTTYVPVTAYSLTALGTTLTSTLTSVGDITLTLTADESVAGALHLLVDGSNTYYTDTPNVYVFTESTEDVFVDVMISNVSIYSITIDVVINRPSIEEPETPPVEEPGDETPGDDTQGGSGSNEGGIQGGNGSGELGSDTVPGGSDGSKDEEKSNLGLIIGLSVGGGVLVIAGVVVLVVVLMKKKEK